jgi:hypothetical protein
LRCSTSTQAHTLQILREPVQPRQSDKNKVRGIYSLDCAHPGAPANRCHESSMVDCWCPPQS